MKVIRYGEDIVSQCEGPVIFLAGPTVRGNQQHLTSWRLEAINLFQNLGWKGTLIVPEWNDKTATDKGWEEILVPWEFQGLSISHCIMFWIPRTRELIGLTTNHEFGYWLAKNKEKMIYGRPNDAYRMGYLDTMWILNPSQRYKDIREKIYKTLPETVDASIKLSKIHFEKDK